MARRAADKVDVIGIASRDDVKAMRAFVAKHDLGHVRHLADEDGDVWRQLGVNAQPTWLFVDDDGAVERHFGFLDEGALAAKLDALAAR